MRELQDSLDAGTEWMLSGLSAVLQAVEVYDRYTYRHCQQVMRYSDWVAQEAGLDQQDRQLLRLAAFLHDVGKVCVPLNLLTKPGRLEPEEWE
ncbi:MAG: HD domain-containing protein, partial [Clostridia bacterium]|nr:HD domain-containing protein [Clostridia bacterium]